MELIIFLALLLLVTWVYPIKYILVIPREGHQSFHPFVVRFPVGFVEVRGFAVQRRPRVRVIQLKKDIFSHGKKIGSLLKLKILIWNFNWSLQL